MRKRGEQTKACGGGVNRIAGTLAFSNTTLAIALGLVILCVAPSGAVDTIDEIAALLESSVHDWRFRLGEQPGAEAVAFDDSDWERVDIGHRWLPHESACWFRKRLVIPEKVSGTPVAGSPLYLRVGVDNEAKAYVNGAFRQEFVWDAGDFLLVEEARPGEAVTIALKGINHPGTGALLHAYLVPKAHLDLVEPLRAFIACGRRAESFLAYGPAEDTPHWRERLKAAVRQLDLGAYGAGDAGSFQHSLDAAYATLLQDAESLDADCAGIAGTLDALEALLPADSGMAYPRADARMVRSFLDYVREDMATGDPEMQLRALTTVPYLARICAQALEEARSIQANPMLDRVVPRYATGPVTIREGAFFQKDRPLFFTGVGHFSKARADVPILYDYGLNIIQMEIGPNSVVLGPDTVETGRIRETVVATLEMAAAHNVMVNLLVSPHYFPEWALEKYPHLTACGHGFMKHCIDAPEARSIYARFLRTLLPLISKHPALHSICLSNEPQYEGRCTYSLAQFHDWLAHRHGDFARLNAIYGESYACFDDVPLPEEDASYPHRFDFFRFNQDRFAGFHRFLADLVHEFDPELPVHTKVMSQAFTDPGRFEVGIDYEEFTRLGSIAGNDCFQTFRDPDAGEYLDRWQDMALNFTLQRSVAPDSPIFNSEAHIIRDGDPQFVPGAHAYTFYWAQALHGQGAAATWVWERAQGGDFDENILTRAHCVREFSRVALDLNRLGEEVHALQQAEPHLAILYSWSSFLPSVDFVNEARAAFEGAYFADSVPAFITESQCAQGTLDQFKLLVAPCASHVPDAVSEAMQRYLDAGGTLLCVGDCFTHNEYGHVREARLAVGGAGTLLHYPAPLSARAYREILDHAMDEAGCVRELRLRDTHGAPVWGVNARTARRDGRLLVSLINYAYDAKELTIETGTRIAGLRDVFHDVELELPLSLPPLAPALIEVAFASEAD